ncbi:hypothetical protein GGI21_005659, partial [Coemansia aciculifera]
IAVPTNSLTKQQQQNYRQTLNERYQLIIKPSVVPDPQPYTPPKSQTGSGAQTYTRNAPSGSKSDVNEGLLELISGLESLSIAEGLSVDTPPDMTITLKPHQRSGVAWMLRNEQNEDVRGGIIGDDMGLGKTVQALSLMMAHPPKDGRPHSTLIVAPLATIEHWKTEAETRVQPGLLKVLVFHHLRRLPTSEELAKYDLVLTTYATLLTNWCEPFQVDFGSMTADAREQRDQYLLNSAGYGPLFGLKWRRVILDEAHEIKNAKSKKSIACHDLVARYRWCLSGTPIQNRIEDVYPLLRFLRLRPYCLLRSFNALFFDSAKGRRDMRDILSKLMLRRDKLMVVDNKPVLDLPRRYFYYHAIDLSIAERIYYDCISHQTAEDSVGGGSRNFLFLLTRLLRLRQTTSHPLVSSVERRDVAQLGLVRVSMPLFISVER